MDGERTYALIVRAGAPQHLDYRNRHSQPFWRLRERLVFRVLEEERLIRWRECVSNLRSAAQGYPPEGLNFKATEALELEALKAAREVGALSMPWLEWPEVESAEERAKKELFGESGGLIEAWIARFEPDNLQSFRDQRAQLISQRAQANAK